MTTPKARPNEITNSYLKEKFKRIYERPAGGFPENVVSNADKMKYIAKANKEIERKEADLAEEARQNLERLDQQLAESNKQALVEEARQNLAKLDQQLAESNKQALAEKASENLAKLDARAEKLGLFKNSGKNAPVAQEKSEKDNTTAEVTAKKVDNGNASKEAKASDLLNNSDKETIGVEKKVSAEAIRQKIEVLNEQVERLNRPLSKFT